MSKKQDIGLSKVRSYLSRILDISKAIKLDLNITLPTFIKAQLLIKEIAIFEGIETDVLATELKANTATFFARLNDLFVKDYDVESDTFGALSSKVLELLAGIFKKDVKDIQLLEFLEMLNELGLKIEEKMGTDFLDSTGMTQPSTPEKLSIIETESNQKKKSEVKS